MAKKENVVFYGTGRRKSSVARVRLVEGIFVQLKVEDSQVKLEQLDMVLLEL